MTQSRAQEVSMTGHWKGDDLLDRMVRAVEKVRERLNRAVRALEAANIAYAVVGGNAVAAWVARIDEAAVRNTPDVDILLSRSDFELAMVALSDAGFVFRDVDGIATFLDGPDAQARDSVHLIFAGERVRPGDPITAPEIIEVESTPTFRVITLDALVRMKLNSFRTKDRMHLRDLMDIGLLDGSWLPRSPFPLSRCLQDVLEDPSG